jgi:hypothetical protein
MATVSRGPCGRTSDAPDDKFVAVHETANSAVVRRVQPRPNEQTSRLDINLSCVAAPKSIRIDVAGLYDHQTIFHRDIHGSSFAWLAVRISYDVTGLQRADMGSTEQQTVRVDRNSRPIS